MELSLEPNRIGFLNDFSLLSCRLSATLVDGVAGYAEANLATEQK